MITTRTTFHSSLIARLLAVAASATTTFALFAGVVSLGDAQTQHASVQIAAVTTPADR